LLTEPGRKIARKILESESDGWWFDKNSDWWVNGNGKLSGMTNVVVPR